MCINITGIVLSLPGNHRIRYKNINLIINQNFAFINFFLHFSCFSNIFICVLLHFCVIWKMKCSNIWQFIWLECVKTFKVELFSYKRKIKPKIIISKRNEDCKRPWYNILGSLLTTLVSLPVYVLTWIKKLRYIIYLLVQVNVQFVWVHYIYVCLFPCYSCGEDRGLAERL